MDLSNFKIGFTGTQMGPSFKQVEVLKEFLIAGKEFHHGDCVGADEQAAHIAAENGIKIIGHPPVNNHKRAFVNNDEEWEPKPYLARNRDIVDATDILIATPKTAKEEIRSGTWMTIRHGIKSKKPVVIINPNGTIKTHNI